MLMTSAACPRRMGIAALRSVVQLASKALWQFYLLLANEEHPISGGSFEKACECALARRKKFRPYIRPICFLVASLTKMGVGCRQPQDVADNDGDMSGVGACVSMLWSLMPRGFRMADPTVDLPVKF